MKPTAKEFETNQKNLDALTGAAETARATLAGWLEKLADAQRSARAAHVDAAGMAPDSDDHRTAHDAADAYEATARAIEARMHTHRDAVTDAEAAVAPAREALQGASQRQAAEQIRELNKQAVMLLSCLHGAMKGNAPR